MRRTAVACLLLAALGCSSADRASRLEALFAGLHERGLFDGAVVVSDAQGIVFERGYGYADAEQRVAFTPATPADGGSLAKTLTAALLIRLDREGVLDLDDPAQKLLPELPYPGVTLRHLLSHSSGIPVLDYDYFDPYVARGAVRTTESLLRVLAEQKPPLWWTPGVAYEYSSFGFDLAALAAERATKRSYAELLSEHFFRKLGITEAFVRPARLRDFPGVRARGYRREGGRLVPNEVFDLEGFYGGSNLYISARELDRWNRAFLDGAALPPAEIAAALRYATIGNAPSGLTLGSWYRTADGSAAWYSGHLQGFHDEVFRRVPERWSIVYVSNNTLEPWLQKAIVRAAVAVLEGKRVEPPSEPRVDAIAREERPLLAGRWILPNGEALAIESAAGHLYASHHGVRYRIVQVGPRWFYVPGHDFMLGLSRRTSRLYVGSNVAEQWARRD